MRIKLVGRKRELYQLQQGYRSNKSELVAIYGRRRVGKSSLLHHFITDLNKGAKSPVALAFEALEGQDTDAQIRHFVARLKVQIKEPLLQRAEFKDWAEVFDYLTSYIAAQTRKTVLSFDEYQWMSAGQSKLTSLLKYYWDNHWKNSNCMLILCGSIASFMVRKVIRSKALYGRLTLQMHIKKLQANEAKEFFTRSKSNDEILRYLMVFGGVPKYLEEINSSRSFEQNIEALFFREDALLLDEFDKIFNVHFKAPRNYLKIVRLLQKEMLNLEGLARSLKMKSSGGLKIYLENLMMAEFIRPVHSGLSIQTRFTRYKIADEFINFYLRFVLPHKRLIQAGGGPALLKSTISKQLATWMGFAFENFIINNALFFANKLGFADKVVYFGPYISKKEGVQVDLLYYRSDKTISVCEVKLRSEPISTEIIPEMEKKIRKLPVKRTHSIHKVLIAPNGISKALRDSEYFDQILEANEILDS